MPHLIIRRCLFEQGSDWKRWIEENILCFDCDVRINITGGVFLLLKKTSIFHRFSCIIQHLFRHFSLLKWLLGILFWHMYCWFWGQAKLNMVNPLYCCLLYSSPQHSIQFKMIPPEWFFILLGSWNLFCKFFPPCWVFGEPDPRTRNFLLLIPYFL